MKKFLFSILAAVSLLAAVGRSESAQVTTLTTSTVKTIITVGYGVQALVIHNIGANQVNITIDGGAAGGGNNPTTGATGVGIPIPAGQWFSVYGPWLAGKNIVGIMATGTTTLNVNTNAPAGVSGTSSTFPTT